MTKEMIINGIINPIDGFQIHFITPEIEECFAFFANSGQKIKKFSIKFNIYPHYSATIEGENKITRIVLTEKIIDFGRFRP